MQIFREIPFIKTQNNTSTKVKKLKMMKNDLSRGQPKNDKFLSHFHRFEPLNRCLSVILRLDEDFPKNLHVICVHVTINKHSFELLFVFGP